MSRIGNNPITIPEGVTIDINGQTLTVKGPKGEMTREINSQINVEEKDGELVFTRPDESNQSRSLHGTMRSVVNNMVEGVKEGFEKKLELVGVGYRAQMQGNKLDLTVGLSHPVQFESSPGAEISVPTNTEIVISGYDKEKVGELAANIRAVRPPEPYNGKGIKYSDERIIRKEGKTG